MFSSSMLDNKHCLQQFFERHQLPLSGEEPRTTQAIAELFADAMRLSVTFGMFALFGIINVTATGIKTFFSSYDDLLESYICFSLGYNKTNSPCT